MTSSDISGSPVHVSGSEHEVEFVPGQHYSGSVTPEQLLGRLRLSPAAAPLDLLQTPLHVWLNGDLVDVDDPTTVLGDGGSPNEYATASAGEATGIIESYGMWLRECWPEQSDTLTLRPIANDFSDCALSWAADPVCRWMDESPEGDIDIVSPVLSSTSPDHVRALLDAAGQCAFLVSLNGVIIDQAWQRIESGGGPDAR
jgi:hypothetical protein